MDPLEEVRRRRLIIHRLDAWLYAEIRPYLGRRVLEVGSGHGNFIQHLLDRELVVATDVEPSSVELVRKKFARYPHVHARLHDSRRKAVLPECIGRLWMVRQWPIAQTDGATQWAVGVVQSGCAIGELG